MYGVRFYIRAVNYFQKIDDNQLDFFLLVFSTVLIAAAGNIINDYFDVKADRINKPEKLIITKHISRRWAILTHWTFNGIAFSIAIFLSVKYQSLWFVFIHLLFAFIQNFAREIVKDIQDVKGDKLIYVKSLPMQIGEWNSLKIVSSTLLLLPFFYVWVSYSKINELISSTHFFIATTPFIIAAIINLLVVVLIYTDKTKRLKLYNVLIKISMLFGVLATFYIAYLYL